MPHIRSARFPVLFGLAMRNLRRNFRRTLLTSLAMILGGSLLIFSFGIGDGSHEQWIRSGVRMGSGHVSIERPEFRTSRNIADRLTAEVRQAAERAIESPDIAPLVLAASAKLTVSGLASSAAGARPVRIVAVDPLEEAAFSMLDDQLVGGRYLGPDDRRLAYVGAGLASSLDLRLGSRFVVQAQDTDREIAGQLLRVAGIFRSGVPEIDQSTIHIPLATAGEWLGSRDDVTSVGFVLVDSTVVGKVARHLERTLQGAVEGGEARVMAWKEANPALASAVAVDDFANYVTYGLLFIVIAFGIMNTVLMSVLHRHREFGVLQALGLTPGETGSIVLFEGLTLTAISGVVGVGVGLLLTWYFFSDGLDLSGMYEDMTFSGVVIDPVILPELRLSRCLQAVAFISTIGGLASIYPALRAARIEVTEVMKFDR